MKIVVLYRSLTGHSKKIARAIGSEFDVVPLDIRDNPRFEDVDLLFFVGGIYSDKSLPETIEYMRTLTPEMVKRVVLVTSSVRGGSGQNEVRDILETNEIEVAKEEYMCSGSFLFIKMGHPNKKEIADAVNFVKRVKSAKGKL